MVALLPLGAESCQLNGIWEIPRRRRIIALEGDVIVLRYVYPINLSAVIDYRIRPPGKVGPQNFLEAACCSESTLRVGYPFKLGQPGYGRFGSTWHPAIIRAHPIVVKENYCSFLLQRSDDRYIV